MPEGVLKTFWVLGQQLSQGSECLQSVAPRLFLLRPPGTDINQRLADARMLVYRTRLGLLIYIRCLLQFGGLETSESPTRTAFRGTKSDFSMSVIFLGKIFDVSMVSR